MKRKNQNMPEVETEKQKARKEKHCQLIALFLKLNDEGGSRVLLWKYLERETGYSRVYIQRILRRNGIDYLKHKEDNGN